MLEYIIAASVYFGSVIILLYLDYKVKKAITVQDLLIAFTPLISTIALILGVIALIRDWYTKNKNKVLFANKPKPKKKKVVPPKPSQLAETVVIPAPKK